MVNWREFQEQAPQLAAEGTERLNRRPLAMLATLRRDGSPRISPIEPIFLSDQLILGMIWQSRKALDLLRDARCVLHSIITDPDANEGEFELRGRALEITDERYLSTIRERWILPASSPLHVFSVDILSASLTTYEFKKGEMIIQMWDPQHGIREVRRTYP
jgi:hypothetical protein